MESRNPPPWRSGSSRPSSRPNPLSTIPAKRPANTNPQNQSAKRSTAAQEEAWVADEDRFVLQQAKKKAAIRVKGGRAKPIDWLAVTLRFIDTTKTVLDDEVEDHDLEIMDPEGVFEGLDDHELAGLEKDIDNFLALETNRSNREYWNAMKVICKDRRRSSKSGSAEGRAANSVQADIDKMLAPKSFQELESLEVQVKKKLNSDEDIDFEYWDSLLRNLRVWKAKAKLRLVSQEIINERLQAVRKQQQDAAVVVQERLQQVLAGLDVSEQGPPRPLTYDAGLDPEPMLKLRPEDKTLEQLDDRKFVEDIVNERRKILKMGYVPAQNKAQASSSSQSITNAAQPSSVGVSRFAPVDNEDFSQATKALYDREVAKGVNEDEEIFTGEEELASGATPQWADKYRPRKPRYFNRVQMGYEWNKYNQTHYDHDNPPPKVVQGYKFNIFYPDLINTAKAPTYRIERENGRKRGQSFAPAGQDDTCLIRFIAGPPYQDIAFRIVDKEWDYSAKRERGFKSSFEKGILQLHFQFKKIYYRK
ncbi:mid region of cactin-domain-containing protein [Clohesyomyces aquaticus]|uniref:Splicing factor Cactin n=1 Tax=Clohesyomyces aquaticus TaxID=1231657 RepID=A0A1Y1Z9J9_9PLEO|nr:mid region of cactin-domain-containing protein [Clohesyomyces aquaticus]